MDNHKPTFAHFHESGYEGFMIIAFVNQKGGTGKTTLLRILAAQILAILLFR